MPLLGIYLYTVLSGLGHYNLTNRRVNTMSQEPVNHLDVTEVAYSIVETLKAQGCSGATVGQLEPSCTFSINISGTQFRVVVTEIVH